MTRVAFLLAAASLATVGGCTSDLSSPGDASVDVGDGGPASGCPATVPAAGGACGAAASCIYGQSCQGTSAVCTGGRWIVGKEVSPAGNCPASVPDNMAACSTCSMASTPCSYNASCDPDGGPTVTVTCIETSSGLVWNVMPETCQPSGDSGAEDSGFDAGFDAGDDGGRDGGKEHKDGGKDSGAQDGAKDSGKSKDGGKD